MEINGQSYSLNNTKKELYLAFNNAMLVNDVENGQTSGINQTELENIEKLIDKYMNSDDENDVKIAQTYKDFVDDLKKADEEYKNSPEFKSDQEHEKKYIEGMKKELNINYDGNIIDIIRDKIKELVNDKEIYEEEINKKNKEKEDLQRYKDSIQEQYDYEIKRSELEKENVITSKTCMENSNKGIFDTDRPINVSGQLFFKD